MRYKVRPQEAGKITLNETDYVTSVLQNLKILLTTRQQTAPLYRGFGLPMRFLDKPIHIARPMIVAEIDEAIRQFEPRATFVDVTSVVDESDPGKLILTVEVEINEEP